MNKYTVTVVVSIEVPVVANSGDEAYTMAERIVKERLNAFGEVAEVEAVCWKEDE